jgi:hypothetical protein
MTDLYKKTNSGYNVQINIIPIYSNYANDFAGAIGSSVRQIDY